MWKSIKKAFSSEEIEELSIEKIEEK